MMRALRTAPTLAGRQILDQLVSLVTFALCMFGGACTCFALRILGEKHVTNIRARVVVSNSSPANAQCHCTPLGLMVLPATRHPDRLNTSRIVPYTHGYPEVCLLTNDQWRTL